MTTCDTINRSRNTPCFWIIRIRSVRRLQNAHVQVATETMVQVTFNGKVIANSDDTVVVENNHYFPIGAVEAEGFSLIESSTR
jgi:uncharacterized protein (DUF427 family)